MVGDTVAWIFENGLLIASRIAHDPVVVRALLDVDGAAVVFENAFCYEYVAARSLKRGGTSRQRRTCSVTEFFDYFTT